MKEFYPFIYIFFFFFSGVFPIFWIIALCVLGLKSINLTEKAPIHFCQDVIHFSHKKHVLYCHPWSFTKHSTQCSVKQKGSYSCYYFIRLLNALLTLKMVLLGTVHWKVLLWHLFKNLLLEASTLCVKIRSTGLLSTVTLQLNMVPLTSMKGKWWVNKDFFLLKYLFLSQLNIYTPLDSPKNDCSVCNSKSSNDKSLRWMFEPIIVWISVFWLWNIFTFNIWVCSHTTSEALENGAK